MKTILTRIADLLGLGIHQRIAQTKKKLHDLERLIINPNRTQTQVLDAFFCQVADLLSFGKVLPGSTLIPQLPIQYNLNLKDFADSLEPFALLSEVVQPIVWIRRDCRHKGEKVHALEVFWLNAPHRQENPFSELGFFAIKAYTNPKSVKPDNPSTPSPADLRSQQELENYPQA